MTVAMAPLQNSETMSNSDTIDAQDLLTPRGKISQGSCSLEEYAHGLEKKLILKSGLLDEAIRLHQGLGNRLNALENGLSWKDQQLEESSRQIQELERISLSWQHKALLLEEENCAIRDVLIERTDQYEKLQELFSLEVQSRHHSPAKPSAVVVSPSIDDSSEIATGATKKDSELLDQIAFLKKQVKEANQKSVLLEEQLRIRSGMESLGGEATPHLGEAFPELALLQPKEAWAAVGRGAADRICGAVPHVAEHLVPRPHKMSMGSGDRSRFSSTLSDMPELRQLHERSRVMTFGPEGSDSVANVSIHMSTPSPTHHSIAQIPLLPSQALHGMPLIRPPYQDDNPQEVVRNVSGTLSNHHARQTYIATTGEPSVADGSHDGNDRHRLSIPIPVDSTPLSPLPLHSRRERSPDVISPTAASSQHVPQLQQHLRIPVRGRASQIRTEGPPPTATSAPQHVSPWVQQSPQATPRTPGFVAPARSISNTLYRGTHGPNTPTSATSSSVPSLWPPRRE